jgi:hypothetical protein
VLSIRDTSKDSRFNPDVDGRPGLVTHSLLCAPVADREGKLIGCIQLINKAFKRNVYGLQCCERAMWPLCNVATRQCGHRAIRPPCNAATVQYGRHAMRPPCDTTTMQCGHRAIRPPGNAATVRYSHQANVAIVRYGHLQVYGAFTQSDAELVRLASDVVGLALTHVMERVALKSQRSWSDWMMVLLRTLAKERNIRNAIGPLYDATNECLGTAHTLLYVYDRFNQNFVVISADGQDVNLPFSKGVVVEAVKSGKVISTMTILAITI